MSELPTDLAPLVLGYPGPGIVIYPNRGTSRPGHRESLPAARLDELVEKGWLTKSIRGYDNDDEDFPPEQDPETGHWYNLDTGDRVPENWVVTSYLSTEKAHQTDMAQHALLERDLERLRHSAAETLARARKLGFPLDAACTQCAKPMNPIEVMLGPVCGECCRENHQRVMGPE